MNDDLRSAFRWHRQAMAKRRMAGASPSLQPAVRALELAREDVAAGKRRYPSPLKPYPVATPQHDESATVASYRVERRWYVDVDRVHLRLVGKVEPDSSRFTTRDGLGWYTYPDGFSSKDGSGLCWGVVYQLSGKDGRPRYVPGYVMGGSDDDNPVLDFSDIRVGDRSEFSINPNDDPAARDAAATADSMARIAAEKECEYQEAWQAGARYADLGEQLAANRSAVLSTIRAMKGACATLRDLPEVLRTRLARSIESDLETRSELQSERRKLWAEVEHLRNSHWRSHLWSAFADGAGIAAH